MDNTRRFAASQRNQALDRLNSITTRAALAGFVGVVGFGGLAAINYRGATANADSGSATTDFLARLQGGDGAVLSGGDASQTGGTTPGSGTVDGTTGSSSFGFDFGTGQVVPIQPQAPVSGSRHVHTSSGGS